MIQVKVVVDALQRSLANAMENMVAAALQDAQEALSASANTAARSANLQTQEGAILPRFRASFEANFQSLMRAKPNPSRVLDYAGMQLVDDAGLEATIALEGMISFARNSHFQNYLEFSTRLNSLFPGMDIDESNNPMDPELIGEAFKGALQDCGVSSGDLLVLYRSFNSKVFRNLQELLTAGNQVFIEHDVLPDLDITVRDRPKTLNRRSLPRSLEDPVQRTFKTNSEFNAHSAGQQPMFELLQSLLMENAKRRASDGRVAILIPVEKSAGENTSKELPGQKHGSVDISRMLSCLSELNVQIIQRSSNGNGTSSFTDKELVAQIKQCLPSSSAFQADDRIYADVINSIALLYTEIRRDETVPLALRTLIANTEIAVLRIALRDTGFFDSTNHPARTLLNALATAGISWTQPDKLESDPVFLQIKETIDKFLSHVDIGNSEIMSLCEQFQDFKTNQLARISAAELRLKNAGDRKQRIDEVKSFALQKINERILDTDLNPVALAFLRNYFHKFVVQMILREGPGGISWKSTMDTVDVLLWTVQEGRQPEDMERFQRVNPRLQINLAKALQVAKINKDEADTALRALQAIQNGNFNNLNNEDSSNDIIVTAQDGADPNLADKQLSREKLPVDEEYLQEVTGYPLGIWLEFQVEELQTIRCTLAAKIDSIDKLVFVNSQGVKVIEKTRAGLARELMVGTVKVISEAPLMDRALESVVGKLRVNHRATFTR